MRKKQSVPTEYLLHDFIRLSTNRGICCGIEGAEKVLEEHKQMFEILEKHLSTFYFIHDFTKFEYVHVTRSIQNMIGLSKEEMIGTSFDVISCKIMHPTDKSHLLTIHKEIFDWFYKAPAEDRHRLRFDFNYRLKKSSGEWIQILQQSVFIAFTKEGNPIYDFSACTDISALRKSGQQVLQIYMLNDDEMYDAVHEFALPQSQDYGISPREAEIMRYVAKGMSSKQIADVCSLSINTVQNHRKNILKKTQSASFSEAIIKVGIQ